MKIEQRMDMRMEERMLQRMDMKLNMDMIEKINQKVDMKMEQKMNQRLEQKQEQRMNQKMNMNIINRITQKPKPKEPKPKPPIEDIGFFDNSLKKRKLVTKEYGKKQTGSFDVYTKVKGKEVLIGSRLTERAAKDVGTSVVLFGNKKAGALSASIILKATSGPARNIQTRNEFQRFGQAFRPSKSNKPGVFVQRETTNILTGRLGTKQEKIAIKQSRKGGMFSLV
jgi:hypothetical protein